MNLPDHYLMTVALHAGVLSVVVFLAVLCLRKPQRIALAALSGLLAIAILPWFSAMRPQRSELPQASIPQRMTTVAKLPEWTIVRLPADAAQEAMPQVDQPRSSFTMPDGWTLLAAICTLGAAVVLGRLMIAAVGVSRWRRKLAAPDETVWEMILNAVPDAPERKHFRISTGTGSPCVAGFFQPVVVLPGFLLDPAKRRELQWALRHELRHWRGADSRWTMILEVIRVFHWWNPFVHLLISRWKIAREFMCDLSAADDDVDRATYGEFLVAMASAQASRNPLAVTMVRTQRLKTLRARIIAVLEAAPGSVTPFEKGVLFSICIGLLGIALMVSGVRIGSEGSPSGKNTRWAGLQDHPAIGTAFAAEEPPEPAIGPRRVTQVKLSTKILYTKAELAENGAAVTDEEMRAIMLKTSQVAGETLVTMPSAVMRVGETATIEIIRENPAHPPWKRAVGDSRLRPEGHAGWSFRIGSQLDGKKVKLTGNLGYGFVPGGHYAENSPVLKGGGSLLDEDANVAWDKLVYKKGSASGSLAPGETLAIRLGEVTPGRHATVFATVEPIDATGKPVPDFEGAMYQPIPRVQGKVKVRGKVMGLQEGSEIGFAGDTLPHVAYFSKEAAAAMEGYLVKKELPEMMISTGEFSRPWDEIAGLSFSLELPADRAYTDLSFRYSEDQDTPPEGAATTALTIPKGLICLIEIRPEANGGKRFLLLELEAVE